MEGFNDEADVEMLREEREYVGDTVAGAVLNGIDEEVLLDNSYPNSGGRILVKNTTIVINANIFLQVKRI